MEFNPVLKLKVRLFDPKSQLNTYLEIKLFKNNLYIGIRCIMFIIDNKNGKNEAV